MRSTDEWRQRAQEDALHAVAAHPGTEHGGWDRRAFYELGRSDWDDFRPRWERYAGTLGGTCLEIGCGAGRITAQLVRSFDSVVALDVSDKMIALARDAAPEATYHLVDGTAIPVAADMVDAVFSCHVLQHFERTDEVIESLLESRRVLRPGGTAMIHLLLRDGPSDVARDAFDHARVAAGRRIHRKKSHTVARRYSVGAARAMFEGAGFADVELTAFRARSNGDVHPFWLATA